MKYLWWKIRVAFWFIRLANLSIRIAFQCADGCKESYYVDAYGGDGPWMPKDAVNEALVDWQD